MHRLLLIIVAATGILFVAPGCRICSDCGDGDYPAYGGAWQRTVRDHGRVGSIFDPAGGRIASLASRDDPNQIDKQERSTDGSSLSDDAEEEESRAEIDRLGEPNADEDDDEMPSLEDVEDDGSRKMQDLKLENLEVSYLPLADPDLY